MENGKYVIAEREEAPAQVVEPVNAPKNEIQEVKVEAEQTKEPVKEVAPQGEKPVAASGYNVLPVEPVGNGYFGEIYNQFKNGFKAAFDFLVGKKGGEAVGVFNRADVGEIDLVWGDKKGGLSHILEKHVGQGKSFENLEDAKNGIADIVENGEVVFQNGDKVVIKKDDKIVTLRKNVREKGKKIAEKNWILTAYDETKADGTSAISDTNKGQAAQPAVVSEGKNTTISPTTNEVGEKSGENRTETAENTPVVEENSVEKDVIDETRRQNEIAREREQRAGEAPRPQVYADAIGKGDMDAVKAWEDKFKGYLQNLVVDDLHAIESTIEGMQGKKKDIKAGNRKGYKDNSFYKAYDGIEKMLKKRKKELEKELQVSVDSNSTISQDTDQVSDQVSAEQSVPVESSLEKPGNLQREKIEDVGDLQVATNTMGADMGTEEFERATERTVEQLKGIVPVKIATKEEAMAVMEIAEMQKRTAPETVSVQDEHPQTVVSSADGAKVLKDLDSAIKEYENDTKTKEKTFLGNLAKVLNAKKHGSNSQYATFEAVNGKVFTIRLANHNATVSTFDNHDESEGISIVVTAQENDGITNDGKAHLVEFYYDAIKLRKADGKPLVEILKSIKQALYSGEYKDNTGLAQVEEVNIPEMMTVYHGSGAKFDKFDHSFMSTGMGYQAYGWGTYVTKSNFNAKHYAKKTGRNGERNVYTVDIPEDNGKNYLRWYDIVSGEDIKRIIDAIPEEKVQTILTDKLMNADMPLHEKVIERLKEITSHKKPTGEDMYTALGVMLGNDKAVSELLSSLGYVGISYYADQADNYVIFNDSDLQITDRIEFYRTPKGTVYGWAQNGEVTLTPAGLNPDTPVHEYTHLWGDAVRKENPRLWNEIVEGMKASGVWNEVARDENYRNIWGNENRMASEVLSRLSGRENYRREMECAREEIRKAQNPIEAAEKVTAWERVKRALQAFWEKVKSLFRGKKGTPLSPADGSPLKNGAVEQWMEFVEMPLKDFWKGVKPDAKGREVEMMGSRVDARMAEVASRFDGKELSPEKRAVVDVFGGKADNLTISVKTDGGNERKVVMRQGNEMGAGAKHSLYRHYETGNGVITAEDILLISEVLANGEREEKQRGNVKLAVYRLIDDSGTRFTVVTEIKEKGEVFNDFYTNKKAPNQTPQMPKGDTQSARTNDLNASTNKGSNNSSNV